MGWEQRLREMVLAGGALAVSACSSSSSSEFSAHDAGSDMGTIVDAGSDTSAEASSMCCNANPDPCCPQLYCGAPMTQDCSAEMACLAEGGTWNPYVQDVPSECMFDGGANDAGEDDADAAPRDAALPDAGDGHD